MVRIEIERLKQAWLVAKFADAWNIIRKFTEPNEEKS